MMTKPYTPEQIINMLREVEAGHVQGQGIEGECLHRTGQPVGEWLLQIVQLQAAGRMPHGEIFHSLKEAQIVIERWRVHCTTAGPHSSLGYRPPAPEAIRLPQHV